MHGVLHNLYRLRGRKRQSGKQIIGGAQVSPVATCHQPPAELPRLPTAVQNQTLDYKWVRYLQKPVLHTGSPTLQSWGEN